MNQSKLGAVGSSDLQPVHQKHSWQLRLVGAIRRGLRSYGTDLFTCRIWCCMSGQIERIELNCWMPSWRWRIALWCWENPTHWNWVHDLSYREVISEINLAVVTQWMECRPANQRVPSLIPSQGICLGCRPGPQWGRRKRQPHTVIPLSLPLCLKINKIFKKKK